MDTVLGISMASLTSHPRIALTIHLQPISQQSVAMKTLLSDP